MKEVWSIIWMFIMIVVTLAIIVLMAPSVGKVMEEALMLDARYQSMELSGMMSSIRLAPEGMTNEYAMPQVEKEGCIKIYRTYLLVDLGQGESQAEIATGYAYEGGLSDIPISGVSIDCTKTQQNLIISKEGGKVKLNIARG
jgi:hypothetical protein